ncbi:hypothetical protein [Actinokineospora bangkokensis]|uniref:TrbL/VirB6 plasmid conjugal transfer protein n=1 Tax=Actinokineospora bangkokensis TaxID=1193682 RepID=A0A1Q9LKQ4_9PSEU|nr:hypothetical protein [Actinokineospora bangkokensis]OLR92583.1 hypothetical protein BJP25_21260 [Actinokineospora bangkokensis]
MWPFDDIGGAMGEAVKNMVASAFEIAMRAIWDASLAVLRGSFTLADRFATFTVDTRSGPVSVLWPMMVWISAVLALGLFFWQMIVTTLRGGRGFLRLITGPAQYGVALAVTVGMVAAFLTGAEGLTQAILQTGLRSKNFSEALNHTSFSDAAIDGIKAAVLGICAFIGVIPAAIGYILEMLFREAAVYVLVGAIPVTAAGLLARVTASWFWRTVRWLLACIAMQPVLAMTLVLGVAIAGGSQGLSGLLAGVGVLLISLFCPFVLFRLFAFVDPNTDVGGAFRDTLSGLGINSYGASNPAVAASAALGAGGSAGLDGGGAGAGEAANVGRFDQAVAEHARDTMDDTGIGHPAGGDHRDADDTTDTTDTEGSPDQADSDPPEGPGAGEGADPQPDDPGPGEASPPGADTDPPHPGQDDGDDEGGSPPGPGGGPTGPDTDNDGPGPTGSGGGGGGGAGEGGDVAEAEEAAVVL